MIVLDASVLIAVLDGADAHADAAREFFIASAADRKIVHPLTLAETLVQAARAQRSSEVATAIEALGVEPLDTPDDPLLLAELRANTGLRMPDCCVLLAALRERATVATFDSRLAAAARGLGLTVAGTGARM